MEKLQAKLSYVTGKRLGKIQNGGVHPQILEHIQCLKTALQRLGYSLESKNLNQCNNDISGSNFRR